MIRAADVQSWTQKDARGCIPVWEVEVRFAELTSDWRQEIGP